MTAQFVEIAEQDYPFTMVWMKGDHVVAKYEVTGAGVLERPSRCNRLRMIWPDGEIADIEVVKVEGRDRRKRLPVRRRPEHR